MPEKLEITGREAILAISFVAFVIFALALAQTGVIASPVTIGVVMMLAVVLLFIGHYLVKAGVLGKSTIPLWYVFSLGLVLVVYGAITQGLVPVAFTIAGASIAEIAIVNSMFYVVVALSIAAAIAIAYVAYKKLKLRYWG